jgi:hypothetical protein
MILTDSEKDWLKILYPLLEIKENDSSELIIKGILGFYTYYDKDKDNFIFGPTNPGLNKEYIISDSYEIEIRSQASKSIIPVIIETEGRILSVAKAKDRRPVDLHINKFNESNRDAICCLCPKTLEVTKYTKGINIRDFMYDLAIPFFYSQSFFENHGDWPFKTYNHGDLGILEHYAELVSKGYPVANVVNTFFASLTKTTQEIIINYGIIPGKIECICKSGKEFRSCHPEAINTLKQLKSQYSKHNILESPKLGYVLQ